MQTRIDYSHALVEEVELLFMTEDIMMNFVHSFSWLKMIDGGAKLHDLGKIFDFI